MGNNKLCPHCGELLKADWCFCPQCGWQAQVEKVPAEDEAGYKMYVKYQDEIPVAYLYGPEWKAMELLADGGYPTAEEARVAWEEECQRGKES